MVDSRRGVGGFIGLACMEKEIVFVVAFHCLYVFNVTIADQFVRIGKVKKYCYICNVVVDYALSAVRLKARMLRCSGFLF